MLKLVVCIVILVANGGAQEHLTCLRTDDVLTQQNPQTPRRTIQGPPGKRGAKGQVGSSGNKGQKGEPGITDNSQMNLVQDQLNSLAQEMEALKNRTRRNSRVMEATNNGLFVDADFYVYQLTPRKQSWQESRQFCQNWGGDLAVHGVKTLEKRRKLIQQLSISNNYFWIGANDIASEGDWTWVNGESASSSELLWGRGEPNSGNGNDDCVDVYSVTEHAYDYICTGALLGLCEKSI